MRSLSLILALGLAVVAGPARAQVLTPEQRIDALTQAIATKVTTKALSVSGASNLVTLTVSGATSLASLSIAGVATLPSATITGGSINGTPIGATTASTGRFTTAGTTGQFSPAYINVLDRGDWVLRIQNAAGNADLTYMGTSGIVNSVPVNSFRLRADAGIAFSIGGDPTLTVAATSVGPGYDNVVSSGASGRRWTNVYGTLLNLTGAAAPTASSDASGAVGDVRLVGNTIYWKTSSGWVRTTGATF